MEWSLSSFMSPTVYFSGGMLPWVSFFGTPFTSFTAGLLIVLELTNYTRAAGQQVPWIHWDSTFYRLNHPSAKPHLWFIFTEAISIHTFYTYATYPKAFIIHGQRPFYVSRS